MTKKKAKAEVQAKSAAPIKAPKFEIPSLDEIKAKFRGIVDSDLLGPIQKLLATGAYKFADDGRVEVDFRMTSETPWIHVRQDPRRNCGIWHQVWFNCYNIIPSYCQQCWKVVVRPTNLTELFQLYEVQTKMDHPSKCGIEVRQSVGALYGGYFYNDSYEGGLACKKMVEDAVHSAIGPHVRVFLKRACTEFEHKFGDSSKWEVSPEQKVLESRLEGLFIEPSKSHTQGIEIKRHVMAGWVRYAFASGDMTAKEYLTQPLYPPYVVYGEDK